MSVGLVRLEVAALIEALGAPRKATLVRLLTCMNADVRLEVEVNGKALLAVGTREGSLSRMHELMSAQLGVVFKGLAAYLALEIIHYMPNYGDPRYWDEHYREQEGETFDWLEGYEMLKEVLQPLLSSQDATILVLGCGNAGFSSALYDDGYRFIVNIDISPVVIEQMKKRHVSRPEMVFSVMDVRKLEFPSNSFDLVVDKSTMDALLCSDSNAFLCVAQMTREVQRVLKLGGHYLCISYGNPENRRVHFLSPHLNWPLKHYKVGQETDLRSLHYAYVCEKKEGWEEADGRWETVVREVEDLEVEDMDELDVNLLL
jgi:SAM-dependent methyltransferase